MTKRASIFETDEIDVSSFAPKAQPAADAVPPEQVRQIAEASNFPSREAGKERAPAPPAAPVKSVAPAKRQAHRVRTGRSGQLNARANQQTIDDFYAIAAAQNWRAAETLERAVAALKRELAAE